MPCFTPSSIDLKRVSVLPIREAGETLTMFYTSIDENKAMTVRLNDHSNYILRRSMVPCLFDIPTVEAARILHVSLSLLKKIRSWTNLECWPCSMIHGGGHPLFTRKQIVEKRELVIAELEKEFVAKPSSMLGLTVSILKEVRQYAAIYYHLVIPGAGRRNRVVFVELKPSKCARKGDSDGVKAAMACMQPRQVVRKTTLSAVGTVDVSLNSTLDSALDSTSDSTSKAVEADVWHTVETCYFSDVEDELGLGPITTPI